VDQVEENIMNIPSATVVEIRKDSKESSRVRRSLEMVLELFVRIG
jgi:hypothetical protein